MKHSLLFMFLFLAGAVLHGQDRSKSFFVRAEAGYATTGTGDLPGRMFGVEAGKHFTRYFKAGLGFNYAGMASTNGGENLMSRGRAASTDLTLYADLLNVGFFNLELGGGGYYRFWNWTYETGPNMNFYHEKLRLGPSSRGKINEQGVGYTVSIGMNFRITPRVEASFRTTYQNDANANNLITLRPGIIFNL